ncbi:hypothetical protein L3V43_01665 [Pseudoalteromonas sp. L23]|uniref:hypothetical protein n=1 Tax=unclassified Pseudoalteromonas TaxID=194690 RepID=UPI001EF00ECB|nr:MULTISPECIES: hypothetical protein [unclassified Pseudoalteromonas]MCF7512423.1 hypothetical protein [Pseudoalteromonas sp. L7]MCF7524363.1 hypothetical protein [Pseudoalteromonas sp. L23]
MAAKVKDNFVMEKEKNGISRVLIMFLLEIKCLIFFKVFEGVEFLKIPKATKVQHEIFNEEIIGFTKISHSKYFSSGSIELFTLI